MSSRGGWTPFQIYSTIRIVKMSRIDSVIMYRCKLKFYFVFSSLIVTMKSTLISFPLPSWRAVRSYRPHLEEGEPIWGNDWSHSPFIRWSPSRGFLGGFLGCKANARRSVHSYQDHFIITLIISDRRDWRDTRGKWPLARNPDRSWWHRHTNWTFFWPQPMVPWTTRLKSAINVNEMSFQLIVFQRGLRGSLNSI